MRQLLCTLPLLVTVLATGEGYCPPASARSGGMTDVMLIYMRRDAWKQADFLPYVAYLDKGRGGRPVDWFFDAWLFLMFGGAPSGATYIHGTATKADWEHYLGLLFSPDHNLAALDRCIEEVSAQLGDRQRVCPVIIMIPYLARTTKNFGDVDGDGVDENPANDADRLKAFRWLIDQVLTRWQPQAYRHLRLWGFYWMMEGIGRDDEAVVKAVAEYIHSKGLGFHWIPWFEAPGFEKWAELGFDFVVMQPNFAFIRPIEDALLPDEDRLSQCAAHCRALGMGIEMEMDSGVETDPGKQLNLQLYLNHSVDELDGYMKGAARAWYQGEDFIAKLYFSDLPEANRLYDDLYRFHKGTYQRRPVSLCEGAECTVAGVRTSKLTDGLWTTSAGHKGRVTVVSAPAVIEVELQAAELVGDVRLRVAAAPQGDPVPPDRIRVLTSADGKAFEHAAEVPCPQLWACGDWLVGFAAATFEPRPARRVRIELDAPQGASVGLEEVVIFPAPRPLLGVPAAVEGDLRAQRAPAAAGRTRFSGCLTDGRLAKGPDAEGALRFAGDGRVRLSLGEAWWLEGVAVHAWWDGAAAARAILLADGQQTAASDPVRTQGRGEGWLELPCGPAKAEEIVLELSGPRAAWDEVVVRPARNLARGKPYTVSPPFEPRYPDTGGVELTDGVLTEAGFGDGRTVGWFEQAATVTIELRQLHRVSAVRVHCQGGGYAAVYFPRTIQVWGSEDGESWQLLGYGEPKKELLRSEPAGEGRNELAWLRLDFPARPAKYVRLGFPARAWLMLSEIEVLEGDKNVALGCRYHLAPRPRAEAKYPDDGIKLTDGDVSRPSDWWRKAVGWDQGEPEVVVDLLHPARVWLVRAHVIGGGPGAVYYPPVMSVATSEDGRTWSDEVRLETQPESPSALPQVKFLEVELQPRSARYVRFRFERRGWLMLDEVQVFTR
ncbi:MAG: DUF4855 domain-containing protein [Armatimonadetes bacterium]|nr:DUF4855 domain-containing protein [Armatimonadota bacterium]